MSEHATELSPGFAERVLRLADRRLAERRQMRWFAGAAVLAIVVLSAVSWIDLAASQRPAARNPDFLSAPAPLVSAESPNTSTDALSYFFPDAEPLDRFAAEDGEDDGGAGAGALFDDQN